MCCCVLAHTANSSRPQIAAGKQQPWSTARRRQHAASGALVSTSSACTAAAGAAEGAATAAISSSCRSKGDRSLRPTTAGVREGVQGPLAPRGAPAAATSLASAVHTQPAHARTRHPPRRYLSDEEEAGQDADSAAADGAAAAVARASGGADLGKLLEEGQQFYSQAHFRYRSFIGGTEAEPPPVDVEALEQVSGHELLAADCGAAAAAQTACGG